MPPVQTRGEQSAGQGPPWHRDIAEDQADFGRLMGTKDSLLATDRQTESFVRTENLLIGLTAVP